MAKVKSKANTASSKRAADKGSAASGEEQRTTKRRSKGRVQAAAVAVGASAAEPDQSPPRPQNKEALQALIVSLLAREAGASLDELVSATRWLPHTTLAALTRLRQSGYAIVTIRPPTSSRTRRQRPTSSGRPTSPISRRSAGGGSTCRRFSMTSPATSSPGSVKALKSKPSGGRKRENMTFTEEKALLGRFANAAGAGEMLNIHDLKSAYEKAIRHETSNSTIYNLLARHGWRKLMPRPFHPKRDIAAQNAFKKTALPML
jgi:Winged helix-turn helix/Protein of unknown function (DUF3489)